MLTVEKREREKKEEKLIYIPYLWLNNFQEALSKTI